jgi:hypothetical protein
MMDGNELKVELFERDLIPTQTYFLICELLLFLFSFPFYKFYFIFYFNFNFIKTQRILLGLGCNSYIPLVVYQVTLFIWTILLS